MNRRGVALLVTLWLLVALTGVATLALAGSRTGVRVSGNRLLLLRAGWAAEACLEIQKGRARHGRGMLRERLTAGFDSIDLGGGVWCRATIEDPAGRLNLNLARPAALLAVLGDSVLVERIVAARPLPALDALSLHYGLDSALVTRLAEVLTVRGAGPINLNLATATVLRALPGLDDEAARVLVERRGTRGYASVDEALAVLPPSRRNAVLRRYPEFITEAVVQSPVLLVSAEGHVGASPLTARMTVTLVPAGDRLATIRREAE